VKTVWLVGMCSRCAGMPQRIQPTAGMEQARSRIFWNCTKHALVDHQIRCPRPRRISFAAEMPLEGVFARPTASASQQPLRGMARALAAGMQLKTAAVPMAACPPPPALNRGHVRAVRLSMKHQAVAV